MNYPIFLIGFMASGKTSKGKKLARKLNVPFIDLDQEVERQEEQSISTIFDTQGEEYFRKLEAKIIRSYSKDLEVVVALGGGTPCFHNNLRYINDVGTSVYMKRSESRILGRLRENKQKRPLIANLNDEELKVFIHTTMNTRTPYYEQANIVFDADNKQLSELIDKLKF